MLSCFNRRYPTFFEVHKGNSKKQQKEVEMTQDLIIKSGSFWKSVLYNGIPITTSVLVLLWSSIRHRWNNLWKRNQSEVIRPVKHIPRIHQFISILFGMHSMFSYLVFGRFGSQFHLLPYWMHLYLQSSVVFQWLYMLNIQKLMPLWFRLMISWPSYFYFASIWFGVIFVPLEMLKIVPSNSYIAAIAFSLSLYGMYQSLVDPSFIKEIVDIDLRIERSNYPETERTLQVKSIVDKLERDSNRILNVFQISDSHLGPFMSEERMRNICQKIVDHSHIIDIVIITGDLETIGSHQSEEALGLSLSPLKQLKGRVFACLGNHDYETLYRVRKALSDNDIMLLEDKEEIVETRIGKVQIIGSIFTFSDTAGSKQHIIKLCEKFPRINQSVPRIMLIHNPSVFPHIPLHDVDIVFSGHYHGGQISFFGFTTLLQVFATIRSLIAKIKGREADLIQYPDKGLYALGRSRLYCHRGTGHYGFPLRLGIPSEQSLIRLHLSEMEK
jgi:predicted MPP superfamily phosphohydrolase